MSRVVRWYISFLARSARGFTLMYARGMYDGSDIGGVRGDDAEVLRRRDYMAVVRVDR